jgi:acyl-CoA thioesterase-1
MGGGMAGPDKKTGLMRAASRGLGLAVALCAAATAALAEGPPAIAPLPQECGAPGDTEISSSPLPAVALALKERKKIRILAIGGTSASLRGPVSGGHFAVVEQFLETTFKGLDVEVVHRGVSGELASAAGERIKNEVALNSPDLVLWQLGTADALARVPIVDFHHSVARTVTWLKDHKTDVILVGLRYARSMAQDAHYQTMRTAMRSVAKEHNVLRISRYEAEETLDRVRKTRGVVMAEAQITEAGYVCLAEYMARAIASGLFVKEPLTPQPAPRN